MIETDDAVMLFSARDLSCNTDVLHVINGSNAKNIIFTRVLPADHIGELTIRPALSIKGMPPSDEQPSSESSFQKIYSLLSRNLNFYRLHILYL